MSGENTSGSAIKLLKVVSYSFLGFVVFVLLLLATAFSSLGVSLLASFANKQEGINLEGINGSLYSQVAIQKLEVNVSALNLQAENVIIDLGINCLFVGEACVDVLSVSDIVLVLRKTEEVEETEPETTKDYITLPLPFTLSQLKVSRLHVFNELSSKEVAPFIALENLQSELTLFQKLNIEKFEIETLNLLQVPQEQTESTPEDDKNLNQKLENWLQTIGDFEYSGLAIPEIFIPINVTAEDIFLANLCSIKNVASFEFEDLSEQLRKVDFNNDYTDSICTNNTTVSTNLFNQKANIKVTSEPDNMQVGFAELSLKVDLSKSFEHEIYVAVYPNIEHVTKETLPLVFDMQGNIEEFSASLKKQTSSAQLSEQSILEANFSGDITSSNLPLSLTLTAKRISDLTDKWLLRSVQPLNSFSLSVNGDTSAYDVEADINLVAEKPTDIKLLTNASLIEKVFNIKELSTSGELGAFDASGSISLQKVSSITPQSLKKEHQTLIFNTQLKFKDFSIQAVTNELQSNLNGALKLNALISAEEKSFDVKCSEIAGMLQNYYLQMNCDLSLNKQGILDIRRFKFVQSDNSIQAEGKIYLPTDLNDLENAQKIAQSFSEIDNNLTLDIALKDLSSFNNSLSGEIVGDATLNGVIFSPQINANLNLNQVQFEQFSIEKGKLFADINAQNDFETNVSLDLTAVEAEQVIADTVSLTLTGNKNDHSINFDLVHPDYSTEQKLIGKILQSEEDIAWQGQWIKGIAKLGFSSLELINKNKDKPTDIYLSANKITVESHCWIDTKVPELRNRNQGLCIDKLDYIDENAELEASFDYNFNQLLMQFAPEYFYTGTELPLNANINLSYNANEGLNGLVQSLVADAKLVTLEQQIDVTAIVANFLISNNKVATSLFAGTRQTGSVGLLSEINLEPDNRQHKGLISINNLVLSPIQRYVPTIEKIDGLIQGRMDFEGALEKPVFNGDLNISNAELAITSYPYPLKNFNQQISIIDNKVDVQGRFELGKGEAKYKANLNIAKGFELAGEITGEGLQLAFEDHTLVASPDVQFTLDPDQLDISGEIIIPKADINIKALPESAKSPSSDIIILGGSQEPPVLPIGLDVDMQIILDPNKRGRVEISALDLDATLQGDLKVTVKQEKNIKENTYSPMQTLVYGSINTLSGSYEAYGQNLQIQRGAIFFNGVPSLPQFDITAIRNPLNTADNVIAGIRVSGNPVLPKVDLFSEPTMIQARQLSYLLQGTDLDGGEGSSNNVMLVNALVSFGIGNSENGVNKLGRSLGFESLNLQTAGQGENTQVQLSGRISDNIQITYGVGLFEQASEIILKYQLMPQLYIEARSGATSAVDLFYEITRGG